MLTPARFQQHCAQLTNPNLTPEKRTALAAEVRDSIEVVHSQEYASFLLNFLPAFKVVLSDLTSPQHVDNSVHKTRAIILEVLNKLPHNNILREKILDVFNMAMDTLKNDNEDNAVTALHIIFDLHKNDRHHLGGQVQPFLDFVRRLYESFGETVEALMTSPPTPTQSNPHPAKISPSTQSFKVITECPLLVMFVFQLYPNLISANIQRLLPLMVRAMHYNVPSQMRPTTSKQVFQEFIASQVKTVSFLAYLLKQFPDVMKSDDVSIPRSVVKLMQTCPGDSVSIRKELLVATRHILTSRFRRGFFDQIDLLLDESVLVGTGGTGTGTLRPLAYSFLAELVHCVRLNLSIPQLEKIIFLFSANVHDAKFSYTLQTNSVRLLLNLVEGIVKVDPSDSTQRPAARELLIRILETLVTKYVTLGEQVPRLLKSVEALRQHPDPVSEGKRLGEVPIGDPLKEVADFKTLLKTLTLGLKTVIWSAINIRVPHPATSKASAPPGVPANSQSRQTSIPGRPSIRTGLLERECEIVSRLLSAGRSCFRLYSRYEKANGFGEESSRSRPPEENQGGKESLAPQKSNAARGSDIVSEYEQVADPARIVAASPQEEREVFDQFAQIFTVLDPPSFQDVFGLRISDLFDYIVENSAAITIPQHFLANSSVSKYFADIMFNFLVENIGYLDVPYQEATQKQSNEGKKANCLLKLFKILFASVSLFPTNEPVLRLHLQPIVKNCLKHASGAEDPHAYLQMLRALFKSITSGKHEVQFDLLYRDFMPLVEPIFTHLVALYEGPSRLPHRELIIELCLMVPARPSTIFPYLEKQIRPIVWALEGGRENPMYGLRTLEFWVDMLQPGYLRLLLAKVEPELTRALHRHLRPPGNAFGSAALRILGKLGARSRSHKPSTIPLATTEKVDWPQSLYLEWQDGLGFNIETGDLISLAVDALLDRRDREDIKHTKGYKGQAWNFLLGCLRPFLGFREISDHERHLLPQAPGTKWLVKDGASKEKAGWFSGADVSELASTSIRTPTVRLVSALLCTLVASAHLPDMKDVALFVKLGNEAQTPEQAIKVLCKYFALLSVQQCQVIRACKSPLLIGENKNILTSTLETQLSSAIFVDAVVEAGSFENRAHAKSALECLRLYIQETVAFRSFGISSNEEKSSQQGEKKEPAEPRTATSGSDVPQLHENQLQASGAAENNELEKKLVNPSAQGADKMDVEESTEAEGIKTLNDEKNSTPQDDIAIAYALTPLLDRLCHVCHMRTWNSRWAGVQGLDILISSLPSSMLSSETFSPYLVRCFKALLYVGRDTADVGNDGNISLATKVLMNIIPMLFQQVETQTGPEQQAVSSRYASFPHEVYKTLALHLTCASAHAREMARKCFFAVAKAQGRGEADILMEVKGQVLKPLQERHLRQHALKTQIGYLDAVNFCLGLGKPVLCTELFQPPLREYVLVESIHIMDTSSLDPSHDTDDGFRAKYHDNKYLDGRTARLLVLLRRKVLDFLCNVYLCCSSSLQEPQQEQIFRLMIACFFRSLQSRDEEMVKSAKRGLKHVISRHPRPKELLQHSLRPLLGNLGDYKKLTIQYLQGLNRVLDLFSHWFSVNLGDKLLEHLQRFTEPEKIAPLKKMMAGTESRVAAAILDLFHLLPAAASKFMEKIVNMVLRLESVIALAAPGAAHLGLKNAMGASTSPYRAPLLKYSNQHAPVASKFFLSRLDDERTRQLFFVMVRSTDSVALRNDLMQMPKRLLSAGQFTGDGNKARTLHVLTLIDLLSRHVPAWLTAEPEIMENLASYWKVVLNSPEIRKNDSQSVSTVRALKTLAGIFIRYCTKFPAEVNLLFHLLLVFSTRTICDYTFIKDFLHWSVTDPGRALNRRGVLTFFLTMFQDKGQPQEKKVHALQYIIIPMVQTHLESRLLRLKSSERHNGRSLAKASDVGPDRTSPAQRPGLPVQSGPINEQEGIATKSLSEENSHQDRTTLQDDVLDADLIPRILKELLDHPDDVLRHYKEPLSAELLRLATILINYMPKELNRYRKELIRFGWNNLKREDCVAKHWAFVNVSRFFEAYQAPPKIILQVYVALLRACQGEGKDLVQQALDILTPALPNRLVHNPMDHKYPIWIRYTKKILLEEGHSVPNLVHIWQLIVRHPTLFYVARAQFVPIMVNSLSRVGLNTAPPTENRRLALDLVHLILSWEETRRSNNGIQSAGRKEPSFALGPKKRPRDEQEKNADSEMVDVSKEASRDNSSEPPTKTRKSEDAKPVASSATQTPSSVSQVARDADDFEPSAAMVDMIIGFLTQVLFRPMDRRETPVLTRRCVSLLEEALSLWPLASVRLQFIEKLLTPVQAERTQAVAGTASSAKGGATPLTPDLASVDPKGTAKNESQKNEKVEQARLKRVAARHSALMTSLVLAHVLTKHQGKKFVEANASSIRAMIGPAVTEGSLQAALQFSALLTEILRAYPTSSTSSASANEKGVPPSLAPNGKEMTLSRSSAAPASSGQKVEETEGHPQLKTAENKASKQSVVAILANEISMGVDVCLKSNDAKRSHCGMLVLQALTKGIPREFCKHQDSLGKALPRMTKENLNGSQPSSNPGQSSAVHGAGSSGHRSVGLSDRVSSLNASQSSRGGPGTSNNQTQENSHANENLRNTKSSGGQKNGQHNSEETRALVLCLSLLGANIATLEPGQRKTVFQMLWNLIDRCVQVEVLLEIVSIVNSWVFWKPRRSVEDPAQVKEPLSAREKVQFLLKMIIFERISGHGSQELMNAYLKVILRIFGGENSKDKRPELMAKLERGFMLGLKTMDSPLRKKFFQIYHGSVGLSLAVRLNYIATKQDWEHLSDTFWIKHATELILSAVRKTKHVQTESTCFKFQIEYAAKENAAGCIDKDLAAFKLSLEDEALQETIAPLITLLHFDSEVAHKLWVMLLPKIWQKLGSQEQLGMERSIAQLLAKEYHQVQFSWRRNNIQTLLESVSRCYPLPLIRPDVVRHLGSRWNAWHSALHYLERRESSLFKKLKTERGAADDRQQNQINADLEDVFDSQASLLGSLHERDFVAALWKHRARSKKTTEALCLEQIGMHTHAQEIYSEALSEQIARAGNTYTPRQTDDPGRTEISFWEERWIDCARSLCQWEVLTEFSRTVVNSKLLHECLWRLPDWSALKELLIKNPVEDGPQLKVYQAYVQLQENKLDVADNFITQGYLKAQEKFCSLPDTFDFDAVDQILVQFQQLVELQESTRILSELNALSRHGNGGVNVDQKVDNIRLILNTWRERLPSPHEPLSYWNDILTWRNHVHAVVVNVLDALKDAASAKVAAAQSANSGGVGNRNSGGNAQTAQVQAATAIAQALSQQVLVMGVNETAWNVHRFAKACRKQGYPDVALYVLQKMYPFGTMELTEYFVKTKETARSFMEGPKGLEKHVENGLNELNRCNMDHFNPRQKAQLFTVKGKLYMALGREDDAVEAYSTALHTSPDVGSAWLAWGQYCDTMQERARKSPSSFTDFSEYQGQDKGPQSDPVQSGPLAAELAFREAAVNCYLQGARFGSRKTRGYLPRVLRLLFVDIRRRLSDQRSTQKESPSLAKNSGASQHKTSSAARSEGPSSDSSSPLKTASALPAYKQGVGKVIADTMQDVPAWMWLPWIPQLVSMLSGREAMVARPLLVRLAQQYPQALFFPLRSFMEDRKPVDTPSKELHKEAMKHGRPIAPGLRLSAFPAKLNSAERQYQAAEKSAQFAKQRYMAFRKQLENVEKALTSSEGEPEHPANLAKRAHLKNELMSTHKTLEKNVHAFQSAKQRVRQIQESITGMQTQQGSRYETGASSGKAGSTKLGEVHDSSASGNNGKKNLSSESTSTAGVQAPEGIADVSSGLPTPFELADGVMTQLVRNHQELHHDLDRVASEISGQMKPIPEERLLALIVALLHRCFNTPVRDNKEAMTAVCTTLSKVAPTYFEIGREVNGEQRYLRQMGDLKQLFEKELSPQSAVEFPTNLEGIISRLRRWQEILKRCVESTTTGQRLEEVSEFLADIKDSEVEVFGQYSDGEFAEPSVEKHVKIQRFCGDIGIVKDVNGARREFFVIGSDGRPYHFVMEMGVKPGAQIAEERLSQLYRLLNSWVFGKDAEAQRRKLHLVVPVVIGMGRKVRLVSRDPSFRSLADVEEMFLKGRETSVEEIIGLYRKLARDCEVRMESESSQAVDTLRAKREAYNEICKQHLPDWCFSGVISSKMGNAASNFVFRKRLAASLGSGCAVSYVLGIEARDPGKLLVSWKCGSGCDTHLRILGKNGGFGRESDMLPFRLTRNIEKAMGRFGVKGPFFGSMASSLSALRGNDKLLEIWMDFLVRDELLELVSMRIHSAMSKPGCSVKVSAKEMERAKENMLEELVSKVTKGCMARMYENTSGKKPSENLGGRYVAELCDRLIARAKDVEKQMTMDVTWQAWL